MSRQSTGRASSPEDVFAKRREETPYQIYFEISNIGRNVESSKKRARWKFCFGDEGNEHERCEYYRIKFGLGYDCTEDRRVTLVHSLVSGKKRTFFDGEMINEAQMVSKEWSFAWSFGAHLLRVGINFEEYSLVIDGIPYKSFRRRDPYLAAQLEATKRDSLRSLQTDEQRRFERLGYSSQGARSRTADRRRTELDHDGDGRHSPMSRSASTGRALNRGRDSATNSRGSPDRAPAPLRRSSSTERSSGVRGGEGRSASVAKSSSTRRQQSPPKPSGPGERVRSKPDSRASRSAPTVGTNGANSKTASQVQRAPDILSADPSTLKVRGFDPNVPETSFDPLASRRVAAAAAVTAAANGNGAGQAQGNGREAWGGNGFGGQGPGLAGTRGSSEDAAAILQLGMQFEAIGMNAHGQQQQHHQAMFFDQGGYHQYDQAGFPMPSSHGYNPPHHQPQHQPQHQHTQNPGGGFGESAPQGFGFNDGGFSGGYGVQGQGQAQGQEHPSGQHQHQDQEFLQQGIQNASNSGPDSASHATEPKAPPDPWDMARSGMVNIDDITDTKNRPMVEVKPITSDDRPLADLAREAPAKEKKPVMIERPEPAPTHMAVAIVPFQAPGQQHMSLGQTPFNPPQQNGNNPFVQVQYTQAGQQPHPLLYAKPKDPFHNL